MSDDIVRSIGDLAAGAAVEVAWAQWSSLTSAAVPAGQPRVWSIVDPEALILLSLAVRDRERRLDDLLAGWARTGSSLLSIQRMKTLARSYPEAVREQVSDFSRHAAEGGDRRWRMHAADPRGTPDPEPRTKDLGSVRLVDGPTLMLRMRAGIGVGAKADLLTFLLGLGGAAADLRTITMATAYSDRAMRTAADEMALARFIQEVAGPRTAYRADPEGWRTVLGVRRSISEPAGCAVLPPWRFWSIAFAFLSAAVCWGREARQQGWSSYVASSRARDLVEMHQPRLRFVNPEMPEPAHARGSEYLDVFRDIVEFVAGWARRSLQAQP